MEASPQSSKVDILIRLLGAFHDGNIELAYNNVRRYELRMPVRSAPGRSDWLYDEIRLSESGSVLHEIEWSKGEIWLIECEEISYSWISFQAD